MRRLLALTAALIALATPAPAAADGDPASDVLLGQDVFLAYSSVSGSLQRELYAVTAGARQRGYPLKIALVGARTDLGVINALFGQPEAYARFLSTELGAVYTGPVLVVMPNGFGLATQGQGRSVALLGAVAIGAGSDGLGTAAVSAARRLADTAGHPLPPSAFSGAPSPGASPATVHHAVTAVLILLALAMAATAGAFVLRARASQ